MIITFKEFKNKVRNNATVCFGSFRFEEADERKGREVSLRRFGKNEQYCYGDASFFFNLPLADSYKMDVYTEYESSFGSNFVKEDAPVDFNADTFFVNVPNSFQTSRRPISARMIISTAASITTLFLLFL